MGVEVAYMKVFFDFLPNQPRNDTTREKFRQMLSQKFEQRLPDMVERIWELPQIILKEPFGVYLDLLIETRELYLAAHFYSCVAMCGIVGERLVKDVLRASVLVEKGGHVCRPASEAFDQFERVDVNGIIRFLKDAGLLSTDAARAAKDLCELRNQYAHARGKDPHSDALKAIRLLDALIKDTVSVFKDFEIKEGALIRKASTPGG